MHPKNAAVTCVIQIQFMIRLDYDIFWFLVFVIFCFLVKRKKRKKAKRDRVRKMIFLCMNDVNYYYYCLFINILIKKCL